MSARPVSARAALGLVASLALALGACATVQRAAERDPMRCERDPKCESKRTDSNDCSTQCADDPACMQRCEQFQAGQRLGH